MLITQVGGITATFKQHVLWHFLEEKVAAFEPVSPSICLSVYLCIHSSLCLPICLPICLPFDRKMRPQATHFLTCLFLSQKFQKKLQNPEI